MIVENELRCNRLLLRTWATLCGRSFGKPSLGEILGILPRVSITRVRVGQSAFWSCWSGWIRQIQMVRGDDFGLASRENGLFFRRVHGFEDPRITCDSRSCGPITFPSLLACLNLCVGIGLILNGIVVTTAHLLAMISQLVVVFAKSVFEIHLHLVANADFFIVCTRCRVTSQIQPVEFFDPRCPIYEATLHVLNGN